jgi:hypothetical protein
MMERDVNLKPKRQKKGKGNRDWSGVMSFKSWRNRPLGIMVEKTPLMLGVCA